MKQVAAHFRQALPQAEITSRLGGDEFAVLLRDADLHAALAAAQQIQAALTPVVNIREIEINVLDVAVNLSRRAICMTRACLQK